MLKMCWGSGTKRDRGWFSVFPTDNLQLASKVETNGSQRGWAVATKMQALHCVAVVVPCSPHRYGRWQLKSMTNKQNSSTKKMLDFFSISWAYRGVGYVQVHLQLVSFTAEDVDVAASTARPDTWRLPSASAKAVVLGPQFLGSRAWETTCSGSPGS